MRRPLAIVLAAAALLADPALADPGRHEPAPPNRDHAAPQEPRAVPLRLLGGIVGEQDAHGIRTGLYVLEARGPVRGGPTHLFTATIQDDRTDQLLDAGLASLEIRQGRRVEVVKLTPAPGGYRGRTRLDVGPCELTLRFATAVAAGDARFEWIVPPASPASR